MIDTHCHLTFPQLASELPVVLKRAEAAGIRKIVIPSTDAESSASAVSLAERHESLFAAIGVHPSDAAGFTDAGRELFTELLVSANKVVAIGEVGLDYYHFEESEDTGKTKRLQAAVFKEMIATAKDYELPLIIHSREAFADTYDQLKDQASGHPAVIHCFTGTAEEAAAWLELGCLISVTGIITYKKNNALREVIAGLPLDRLMLETDAPFLAPEGFRGQIGEPRFVREVAQCLAEIQGTTMDYIDVVTTQTAERFFNIVC